LAQDTANASARLASESCPQCLGFRNVRLKTRIPADHPQRAIRELIDEALRELADLP
jgi:hypothetical protein